MKSPGNYALTVIIALLVLAAVAPVLIALSSALLPLVVAVAIAAVIVRLVFFHTRGW